MPDRVAARGVDPRDRPDPPDPRDPHDRRDRHDPLDPHDSRERHAGGPPGPGAGRGPAPVEVTTRCQGCGACLLTCPAHAIRPRAGWAAGGETPLYVLPALCTGCGECLEVCPVDAIEEVE